MKFVDFKTDKIGETQVSLTSDPFKGFVILIRTSVSAITFDDKYDDKGKPVFGITMGSSIIIIPPKVDIRKEMK